MDEQMIADIRDAIHAARFHHPIHPQPVTPMDASDEEYATRLAIAAHSVMAGKVAAIEDALAWAENHDPQLVDAIASRRSSPLSRTPK